MTTLEAPVGPEPPTSKPPILEENSRLIKIKKLKAKLINEEHRLVLMKKIRQSQTRPVASQSNASSSNSNSTNNNNSNNNNILNNNNNTNQRNNSIINHNNNNLGQSSLNIGPGGQIKKLRPNSSGGSMALNKHQSGSLPLSSGSTPSLNQTPAHAHQRPKVNTLWNPPPQQSRHPTPAGLAAPHVGNLSRQPITTPPNVVQAMMGNLTGPQSLLLNQINAAAAASNSRRSQQLLQQSQPQNSFNPKTQAAQLLMQKKTNFKPSIQKQLEQTILQQQQLFQQSQKQTQSSLGFAPNLNKRSSLGITSPHVGNLSRPPITTPPNVVQDLRGTLSGQQSLLMNSNNLQTAAALAAAASRRPPMSVAPSNQTTSPLQSSSFNKATSAQMLLQKKSAAKSAIQKQLEQTLMQLPQKQIQSPIDFLPNANNIEYVYYIGLEACVDYLTDTKNPLDKIPLEKPHECSTCGTDFTPAWSWKKTNELVCENCVGNSVRKSIKNTQSNRIKSILAKAVKQESEMEQRIMAEATNVTSTASPTSSSSQQPHSLLQPSSHHQQQTPQRGSTSQAWSRINSTPQTISSSNRSTHVQPTPPQQPPQPSPQATPNPLAGFQPAALAAFLQTNPQFSSLASLINNNNTNNQLAQVTQLLMNQMFGNFRR